jgi:hypothetical protein
LFAFVVLSLAGFEAFLDVLAPGAALFIDLGADLVLAVAFLAELAPEEGEVDDEGHERREAEADEAFEGGEEVG